MSDVASVCTCRTNESEQRGAKRHARINNESFKAHDSYLHTEAKSGVFANRDFLAYDCVEAGNSRHGVDFNLQIPLTWNHHWQLNGCL